MSFTRVSLGALDEQVINPSVVEIATFNVTRNASGGSPYLVKSMFGLDADDLVSKFTGMSRAASTGSAKDVIQYARREPQLNKREIVLRLVMNPRHVINETFSNLRDQIFRAISYTPRGTVQLTFYDGAVPLRTIEGTVTKVEAPYFSEVPEMQITIDCPDTLFRSPNKVSLLPDDLPKTDDFLVTDFVSTAPHGFGMVFAVTKSMTAFTISNAFTDPAWKFKVAPSGGFQSGDTLYLGTDVGSRYVYFTRMADELNTFHLMNQVAVGSVWPTIYPGPNSFNVSGITAGDWVVSELEYKHAYWGV